MPDFSVNTNVLKAQAQKASQAKRTLNTQSYEISRIRSRLFGITLLPVRVYLLNKSAVVKKEARRLAALSTALGEAVQAYNTAENHILEFDGSLSNPAFNGPQGQYGGRQAGPSENLEEMINIVRKYHPDWSRSQIKKYLNTLNSEGCGYVAMVNTIYLRFKGREDEFERIFGFPMYDKNGNLNYNALITDFYTAKDDPGNDGTTLGEREQYWEEYCRDHGISVDVRTVDVNVQNYKEMVKDGEIVVGLRPLILYTRNADGTYEQVDDRDAGHAMTITGVTDDGRFIVSSWGETYYLDSDMSVYDGFLEFQQVVYE